jgi:hypothetical protein
MSQLDINGVHVDVNPAFQTWKDVLFDVESSRLEAGQVIASVKFDGDDVPSFREAPVLSRPLQSLAEIRIEVVPKTELSLGALQEAETYVGKLKLSMVDVAESFRIGDADPANQKLQQVLEGIKMLAALARGIELSLDSLQSRTSSVERTLEQMRPALEELINAQLKRDWTLVADILEYELLAHFSRFETTLNEFKNQLRLD